MSATTVVDAINTLVVLRAVAAEQLEERKDEREQRFLDGLDEVIGIADGQLTIDELTVHVDAYDLAIDALERRIDKPKVHP